MRGYRIRVFTVYTEKYGPIFVFVFSQIVECFVCLNEYKENFLEMRETFRYRV